MKPIIYSDLIFPETKEVPFQQLETQEEVNEFMVGPFSLFKRVIINGSYQPAILFRQVDNPQNYLVPMEFVRTESDVNYMKHFLS